MKVFNKCGNGLSHSLKGNVYYLANDTIGDIPEEVAKAWLKIKGVTEYIAPEDLEKLKAENEALKAKTKAKVPAKKSTTKKK